MTDLQDHFIEWAVLWGRVQGRGAIVEGSAVLLSAQDDAGEEAVLAWPVPDTDQLEIAVTRGRRLTLATTDERGVREFSGGHGLATVGEQVLLTAATADVAQAYALPENAQLASAPMENYDVSEISVFDHPVCGGRISVGENAAVIGKLWAETPHDRDAYEPALLGALAEEAYLHGAGTLVLIAAPVEAERFVAAGWAPVGHVLTFEKA